MKAVSIISTLFTGALGSALISRQAPSGGLDSLTAIGNQVQQLVANLTTTVNTIKTPSQLMTTLPILVGDLTEINSTLASLGPLLSANPAMAASSATGAANGLSISLGSAAKRQADSGLLNLPGLGALSGITGPLAPLIQILGAVLDGVTALAGLKNLTSTLPSDQSDQLTNPLNGILGLVGSILPLGAILQMLHL